MIRPIDLGWDWNVRYIVPSDIDRTYSITYIPFHEGERQPVYVSNEYYFEWPANSIFAAQLLEDVRNGKRINIRAERLLGNIQAYRQERIGQIHEETQEGINHKEGDLLLDVIGGEVQERIGMVSRYVSDGKPEAKEGIAYKGYATGMQIGIPSINISERHYARLLPLLGIFGGSTVLFTRVDYFANHLWGIVNAGMLVDDAHLLLELLDAYIPVDAGNMLGNLISTAAATHYGAMLVKNIIGVQGKNRSNEFLDVQKHGHLLKHTMVFELLGDTSMLGDKIINKNGVLTWPFEAYADKMLGHPGIIYDVLGLALIKTEMLVGGIMLGTVLADISIDNLALVLQKWPVGDTIIVKYGSIMHDMIHGDEATVGIGNILAPQIGVNVVIALKPTDIFDEDIGVRTRILYKPAESLGTGYDLFRLLPLPSIIEPGGFITYRVEKELEALPPAMFALANLMKSGIYAGIIKALHSSYTNNVIQATNSVISAGTISKELLADVANTVLGKRQSIFAADTIFFATGIFGRNMNTTVILSPVGISSQHKILAGTVNVKLSSLSNNLWVTEIESSYAGDKMMVTKEGLLVPSRVMAEIRQKERLARIEEERQQTAARLERILHGSGIVARQADKEFINKAVTIYIETTGSNINDAYDVNLLSQAMAETSNCYYADAILPILSSRYKNISVEALKPKLFTRVHTENAEVFIPVFGGRYKNVKVELVAPELLDRVKTINVELIKEIQSGRFKEIQAELYNTISANRYNTLDAEIINSIPASMNVTYNAGIVMLSDAHITKYTAAEIDELLDSIRHANEYEAQNLCKWALATNILTSPPPWKQRKSRLVWLLMGKPQSWNIWHWRKTR